MTTFGALGSDVIKLSGFLAVLDILELNLGGVTLQLIWGSGSNCLFTTVVIANMEF